MSPPWRSVSPRFSRRLGTYEIVFVDDRSTDGTLAAIRALANADKRVRFVSFVRNFGHQVALRAGLRHARGSAVILMDCDFEHPPELIPELVARWREGAKVVVTQRSSPREATSFPSARRRNSTTACSSRCRTFRSSRAAPTSCCSIARRSRPSTPSTITTCSCAASCAGSACRSRPSAYTQGTRSAGESSYTLRRMIDLAVVGIISHSIRPLRIAIYLALLFAFAAVPAVRLFDRQLPLDRPHRGRLDLDHVGDRHPRRRPVPGARHHRRVCRARAARDPALAALPDRGDRSLAGRERSSRTPSNIHRLPGSSA